MITSLVRSARLDAVKQALGKINVVALSVVEARDYTPQRHGTAAWMGHLYALDSSMKMEVQVIVDVTRSTRWWTRDEADTTGNRADATLLVDRRSRPLQLFHRFRARVVNQKEREEARDIEYLLDARLRRTEGDHPVAALEPLRDEQQHPQADAASWDVVTLLRSQPDMASIPVVVLCPTHADPPLVGLSDFLPKPIVDETLAAALDRLHIATPGRSLAVVGADEELAATVRRVAERQHWKSLVVAAPFERPDDVARTPADAIVFDLGSSVRAGLEVLQRVRVSEHTRRVPLIVATAGHLTPLDRLLAGGYLELDTSKDGAAETFTAVAQLVSACVERSTQRRSMANG